MGILIVDLAAARERIETREGQLEDIAAERDDARTEARSLQQQTIEEFKPCAGSWSGTGRSKAVWRRHILGFSNSSKRRRGTHSAHHRDDAGATDRSGT